LSSPGFKDAAVYAFSLGCRSGFSAEVPRAIKAWTAQNNRKKRHLHWAHAGVMVHCNAAYLKFQTRRRQFSR
jgi:hypothetical protein